MIRLINATTGTDMWVADDRADEYIKAGHKPFKVKRQDPPKKPVAKKTTKKK